MTKKERAPRLKAIAAILTAKISGIVVTLEPSYSNTDRKLGNSRLIHPGKGRNGHRLTVKRKSTGVVLISHDSSHAYRSNDEVVRDVKLIFGLDLMKEVEHG